MSWVCDSNELVAGGWLSSAYAGHGIRGDAVPSSGLHGASFLFNDLTLPADAAVEVRCLILSVPSAGTFAVWEDGSFSLTGAPDGIYTISYRLFADGQDQGTAVATITLGSGVSDLSGNATLDGVSASGTMSGGSVSTLSGSATLDSVGASGGITGGVPSGLSGGATLDGVAAGGGFEGVGGATYVFGHINRVASDRRRLFAAPYGAYGPLRTVVDAKHVAEVVPLLVPFGAEVPEGDSIVSATCICTVRRGVDANPGALLRGAAIVDNTTSEVAQWVHGGVAGTRYLILFTATLSNGAQLVRSIELPVIDFLGAGT